MRRRNMLGLVLALAPGSQAVSATGAPPRSSQTEGPATAALINRATSAAAPAGASLHRLVSLGDGRSLITEANETIHVRKGQSLRGAGLGATTVDMTGSSSSNRPVIAFGSNSSGVADAGGQAVELADMTILGGPHSHGSVDTGNTAGWAVHNVFFSAPGIGLRARGSDGLIHNSIFELGLNHIWLDAFNCQLHSCLFYSGNYQLTLKSGSSDISINACQFEYFKYNAVLFGTLETGIYNIALSGCNFIQNEQFETSEGAISARGVGSDFKVSDCTFRNLRGSGLRVVDDRATVISTGNIYDGTRTHESYAQSTSMRGITVSGGQFIEIRNDTFRNLNGQPIEIGGHAAIFVLIEGARFFNNRGGSSEIAITNTNANTKIIIRNCIGDGRPMINEQSIVNVVVENCFDTRQMRNI